MNCQYNLRYKGFEGSVHYSESNDLYYGEVLSFEANVRYEGIDEKHLQVAFQYQIEEYLRACNRNGILPMKHGVPSIVSYS